MRRNSKATSGDWRSVIADVDADGRVTAVRELDLVPDSTMEILPIWSPDSTKIAYLLEKAGTRQIAVGPADGSAPARPVGPNREAGTGGFAYAWSPDGETLLLTFMQIDGPQTFWSVDVETGEHTAMDGPTAEVPSWQRIAP